MDETIDRGRRRPVSLPAEGFALRGDLTVPEDATGLVLFAHGSGSSRLSWRNRWVARELNDHGLATLLFDLLTEEEEQADREIRALRFDVALLARRLATVTGWVETQPELRRLPLGYFGASTGAAAALVASIARPDVRAIVSRGGRPDLAGDRLGRVRAATLLIVGGDDYGVIGLNRQALARLRCEAALEVVPGATHLFEEPGTLEQVAELAARWFHDHLKGSGRQPARRRASWTRDSAPDSRPS